MKFRVTKNNVEYEFETAKEGGYVVSVPLYPSCCSQGETFKEALENIQDALLGCLESAVELNLPVPIKLRRLIKQTIKS